MLISTRQNLLAHTFTNSDIWHIFDVWLRHICYKTNNFLIFLEAALSSKDVTRRWGQKKKGTLLIFLKPVNQNGLHTPSCLTDVCVRPSKNYAKPSKHQGTVVRQLKCWGKLGPNWESCTFNFSWLNWNGVKNCN